MKTLVSICIETIRRHVTITRFPELHKLGLPMRLRKMVAEMTLDDFHINPAEVRYKHHLTNMYPATAVFDDTPLYFCTSFAGDNILPFI